MLLLIIVQENRITIINDMDVALTLAIIIISGCVSIIDNSDNPNHPCISALAQIYAESFLGLHRIPPSARDINSTPGESRKKKRSSSDSSSAIFCYTIFSYYVMYSKMCYSTMCTPHHSTCGCMLCSIDLDMSNLENRLGMFMEY